MKANQTRDLHTSMQQTTTTEMQDKGIYHINGSMNMGSRWKWCSSCSSKFNNNLICNLWHYWKHKTNKSSINNNICQRTSKKRNSWCKGSIFPLLCSITCWIQLYKLQVTFEETNRVKETKMNILLGKYETFKMKFDKTITRMNTEYTEIINGLVYQGKILQMQ